MSKLSVRKEIGEGVVSRGDMHGMEGDVADKAETKDLLDEALGQGVA